MYEASNIIKALARRAEIIKARTTITQLGESLINQEPDNTIVDSDKNYDLVYILKKSDYNPDLRMSLRSIEKFCTYRKIWIIGYKPEWLTNVEYVETEQKGNKWQNSTLNWKTACETDDISDKFILMNDDFIALRPIHNWEESLNICLGTISAEAEKWSKRRKLSRWQTGFISATELLKKLHTLTDYNYEVHAPMIVNKKEFLEFIELPEIVEFLETSKVLHKRSIYKNLYPNHELGFPRKIKDVKVTLNFDLNDSFLRENWISVFDDVIGNSLRFPKINKFLDRMFPNKSIFELD